MSEEWKKLIPKDPVEMAFWDGWHSSSESHCRRWFRRSHKTFSEAWNESMSKEIRDKNIRIIAKQQRMIEMAREALSNVNILTYHEYGYKMVQKALAALSQAEKEDL